uniref:Bulb-type lectin domain-containing protein n=1 Tax=Odontella aurita TaxID=265563 RepID=A0A7S4MPB9_9STRA|mmetsp:Transcript_27669/g.81331  ORF Transcript_27669/g.81331 Transcript_27669/m.81331 type:complete len:166 (+) Transcript_27669:181-678(+)|eukprot:CAMPEP_0113537422 /NCGR_PEP_ID=MMETSP0015_2-20120614/6816_1 /TAXON_ID=2838 /ORGANISM="Odontella" /LENGTH=165 /DNA_ID=CAMNT_0000436913 /DNA_START=120 /DNA_END=617 /DNA_ORIENTATION=- /assembly_acc=CAM_ASM_000160
MKISWISALVVLPAARGNDEICEKTGSGIVVLEGGESIKRSDGAGICTENWIFWISSGKGKLQLKYNDGAEWRVVWKAKDSMNNVLEGIKECRMQQGGAFVCFGDSGNRLWSLNCGGLDDASLYLYDSDTHGSDDILVFENDPRYFTVTEDGEEYGDCVPKTDFD